MMNIQIALILLGAVSVVSSHRIQYVQAGSDKLCYNLALIANAEDCVVAAKYLGLGAVVAKEGSWKRAPKGCYWLEENSKLFFNAHSSGSGRSDPRANPLCKPEKLQGEKKNAEEKLVTTMEELSEAQSRIDELARKRQEGEREIKRVRETNEDDEYQIITLHETIAELTARIEELEAELENERKLWQEELRQIEIEMEETNPMSLEQGGIERLQKEMDTNEQTNEATIAGMKSKHMAVLVEAQDELENVKKEDWSQKKLQGEKKNVEEKLVTTMEELSVAQSRIDELTNDLGEQEREIKEVRKTNEKDEKKLNTLKNTITELTARIEELEAELENKWKLRQRLTLDDSSSKLEELIEQLEIKRLKKEMDTNEQTNEATIAGMKSKHMAVLVEDQKELENVKKQMTK